MILYTADVEYAETDYDVGCLQFHVENAHMIGIDSEKWLMQAKENIACQEFSFETQMHLIMLPLTYKGSQAKNDAIATCVELASKIEDMHTQNFVLAGILTFTDKIISEEMRKAIERRIRMTKIGASLMETGRQEGQAQSLTASVESVMKELSVSLERACQIVGTTVGAYDDARKLLGR